MAWNRIDLSRYSQVYFEPTDDPHETAQQAMQLIATMAGDIEAQVNEALHQIAADANRALQVAKADIDRDLSTLRYHHHNQNNGASTGGPR